MNFLLRPYRLEDVADLARYADNPKVAANLRDVFVNPYSEADAHEYVTSCIAREGQNQLVRAIEADGHVVGSIGAFVGVDVYRRSAELGYWLAEEYWGRGIMSEAVRRICRDVLEQFDVVRLYAEPYARNTGSRRVLEKAGFTLEGVMRSGVFKNGEILDYCMYALLR